MVKLSLKAARINANLAQKTAAQAIGVSNKTLGNWENGVTSPPANKIPTICELYGVPYDQLNFLPSNPL